MARQHSDKPINVVQPEASHSHSEDDALDIDGNELSQKQKIRKKIELLLEEKRTQAELDDYSDYYKFEDEDNSSDEEE